MFKPLVNSLFCFAPLEAVAGMSHLRLLHIIALDLIPIGKYITFLNLPEYYHITPPYWFRIT